jgi:hypothetical protein
LLELKKESLKRDRNLVDQLFKDHSTDNLVRESLMVHPLYGKYNSRP